MKTFYRIILPLLLVLMAAYPVHGQSFRGEAERQALIDSLSSPVLAEGSGVMRFEDVHINAGEMDEDSKPSEYVFRWTNEGTAPLSVVYVKTTCGCAAPSYDRTPVRPGESASLKVTYHPKGHPGGFLRKIFVYTNLSADMPTAVLELSGRVIPSVLPTSDYPIAMGGLLLKRSAVSFARSGRQTERIECLNAGDKPLEISVDSKTLPAGVRVEPLAIAPGQVADLVIRFDPANAAAEPSGTIPELPRGKATDTAPVFLKGIGLPPTKCMITINFN